MKKPEKTDKNYCPECDVFLPTEAVKHGPTLALLAKLGSIIVHTDELLSSLGHGWYWKDGNWTRHASSEEIRAY